MAKLRFEGEGRVVHTTRTGASVLPCGERGGWYVAHPEQAPYFVGLDGAVEHLIPVASPLPPSRFGPRAEEEEENS